MDEVLHTKIDLVVALGTSERLGYNEGVDNHFSCLVPGTEEHFLYKPASHALIGDLCCRPGRIRF